jgi:hypothetical protein
MSRPFRSGAAGPLRAARPAVDRSVVLFGANANQDQSAGNGTSLK